MLIRAGNWQDFIIIASLASWKEGLRIFLGLAIILGLGVSNVKIFWVLVLGLGAVSDVLNVQLHGVLHVRGRGHHAPIVVSCPSTFYR